jgi:hypothetical protein
MGFFGNVYHRFATNIKSTTNWITRAGSVVGHGAIKLVPKVASSVTNVVSASSHAFVNVIQKSSKGAKEAFESAGIPQFIKGIGQDVVADLNIPNQIGSLETAGLGAILGIAGLVGLFAYAKA